MKIGVEEIIDALTQIHSNQIFEYRVALSMGALLERPPSPDSQGKTGELDVLYFHPSSNNASLFWLEDDRQSNFRYIRKNSDLEGVKTFLRDKEWTSRRADTSWSLVGNVNANIYIVRVHGAEGGLIGHLKNIPGFLRRRGLLHFHRDLKNKRVLRDNLCFFRCLSHFLFQNTTHCVELLQLFFPNEKPSTYKGICLSDLARIEAHYGITIRVLSLIPKKEKTKNCKRGPFCALKCVRGSLLEVEVGTQVMTLNLHDHHFSLVVDMEKYTQFHMCPKCHRLFQSEYNLRRHTNIKKDCTRVRFIYKGGVYKNTPTIFERLLELGLETPRELRIYPYKIVYDFESYFSRSKNTAESQVTNTLLDCHHVPLSASVASDFPGWENPVCFIRGSDAVEDPLVKDVLTYIESLSVKIGLDVERRFSVILAQLDQLKASEMEKERLIPKAYKKGPFRKKSKKHKEKSSPRVTTHRIDKLKQRLLYHIRRVPVLGFNSGRYDLNLIKRDFHSFYTETDNRDIRTIKRCNQYIAVYTEHSLFLDMVNYLAPGYSYANYLKAFIADECKGFFPYEWMTSTRKLSNARLPPRAAFYSSLTGTGISQEQYNSCLLVWRELGMKTFRDYLIYYNNKDVAPFVKAINEHMKFFIGKGIDMFKDGMTLPGLTLKLLFEKGAVDTIPYVLFSEADKDVHELVRSNLVGGPSIIFHRHHKSGSTRIREMEYGTASKVCRHILGVDANSLYLKCMGEDHCTGYYVVRRRENRYHPEQSQQVSRAAAEWLRFRAITDNVNILHQYNHGEVSLGQARVRVDGLVPELKRVYQFHGCYWHGHFCHLTTSTITTESGRNLMRERCANTTRTTMYLKCLGYEVVEEHECNWVKIKKRDKRALETRSIWSIPKPDTKIKVTQNEIIEGVKKGSIFGLVCVDIETPEELKDHFSEMTPIFKNTLVSRDDVGAHMREHLKSEGKIKIPQRQLIGSYFAQKILLGSPLLKWYLEKGLLVTTVHLLVEYVPDKSFLPFVNQVTEARREGDKNPDCKILSDLYKLLGNSSYGKTICNKQNFTDTRYMSPEKARRIALHWTVQDVQDITDNTYEVTSLPTVVTYDLPIQIGFMVYQYAKLKMLRFYYDFLTKYINRRDFQLCEMDTDSLYFALSSTNFDELIIPDKREAYYSERHLWLPSESCDDPHHRSQYVKAMTFNLPWFPLPCCIERQKFDKRTPGLFKIEWEGDEMTSLNSKCYIGCGDANKTSCKGVIQKQNLLDVDCFNTVLDTKETHHVVNTGFKVTNHHIVTYKQKKRGLNYQYIKRKICEDGVSTLPLEI